MESEEELRAQLVDKFGFSYATATEILKQENKIFIISCIAKAYTKGKGYHADSWQGTSYG